MYVIIISSELADMIMCIYWNAHPHSEKAIKSNLAMQSPVLKGHLFFSTVMEDFIWIEPLLRGHLS
jgi:hypothetical protein